MTRTRLAVAGLLVASVAVPAFARAAAPTAPLDATLQTRSAEDAMLDLEAKLDDNLQQGKAVPVGFRTAAQVPGDVVATGGWGDSGLWTGVLLGGEAMRYATAKAHLAALPTQGVGTGNTNPDSGYDDQRDFWVQQRDQAMTRMRTILEAEHRDFTIAENWTGHFHVPTVDPQGYPLGTTVDPNHPEKTQPGGGRHLADFGGTEVVQGQPGMIMRACTLAGLGPMGVNEPSTYADDPTQNHDNRVYRLPWKDKDGVTRQYNCEASPSRDTYAGVTFGLLTAFDLLGTDAPDLTSQIRGDLVAMGDFLLKYGWSYPRPTGYVSAYHDFDGFLSPLFVYVPMARLNLTNAVRHVVDHGGSAADRRQWDAVWKEELASEGPQLAASLEVDAAQPNDGYYKFNLHHLAAFNLLRTTTGTERELIAQAVSVLDKTTGDDVNAHFEAIIYAATGDASRRDAAITHLLQWLQYRQNVSGGHAVDNSQYCDKPASEGGFPCVPQDRYEVVVDGQPPVAWFPGTKGKRAENPLPVAQRPPTDFLWQRAPTDLDGSEAANWREAGVDFVTPYWMLRYFSEVAVPAVHRLPAWPGPASH